MRASVSAKDVAYLTTSRLAKYAPAAQKIIDTKIFPTRRLIAPARAALLALGDHDAAEEGVGVSESVR